MNYPYLIESYDLRTKTFNFVNKEDYCFRDYYAVARGRRPGIYRYSAECRQQVKGFEGAMFRRFESRRAALRYLKENRISDSSLNRSTTGSVCGNPVSELGHSQFSTSAKQGSKEDVDECEMYASCDMIHLNTTSDLKENSQETQCDLEISSIPAEGKPTELAERTVETSNDANNENIHSSSSDWGQGMRCSTPLSTATTEVAHFRRASRKKRKFSEKVDLAQKIMDLESSVKHNLENLYRDQEEYWLKMSSKLEEIDRKLNRTLEILTPPERSSS